MVHFPLLCLIYQRVLESNYSYHELLQVKLRSRQILFIIIDNIMKCHSSTIFWGFLYINQCLFLIAIDSTDRDSNSLFIGKYRKLDCGQFLNTSWQT